MKRNIKFVLVTVLMTFMLIFSGCSENNQEDDFVGPPEPVELKVIEGPTCSEEGKLFIDSLLGVSNI